MPMLAIVLFIAVVFAVVFVPVYRYRALKAKAGNGGSQQVPHRAGSIQVQVFIRTQDGKSTKLDNVPVICNHQRGVSDAVHCSA